MKRMAKLWHSLGTYLVVPLLLAGCVSSQRIVTGRTYPAIDPARVRVYSRAPSGAQEVALLNATAGGDGQSAIQSALARLRKDAAALGANGLVILGSGVNKTSSGGIGYLDAGSGVFLNQSSTDRETIVKARAIRTK